MTGFARTTFFLDATPLLDESWTGIPVVCAHLARGLLANGCELEFCLGAEIIPRHAVLEALDRNTGLFLQHELQTGQLARRPLTWGAGRRAIGLSASVKRLRRVFDVEASIIHDISTLLQPQFHTPENIAWHAESIVQDLASNDVTFCISQATLDDLVLYLGADPKRLYLIYNGVEWPFHYAVRAAGALADGAEPYLLVLATREPRKNLALVLEMLAGWPELLDEYRCVFVGKAGWLLDQTAMPEALAGAVARGRVLQTGFVGDYEKYLLLRGAEATIFPSIFEGFGLPVLETLSVGTPCVASFSSSIPEVGGELCRYFDPFSVSELRDAVEGVLGAMAKQDPEYGEACSAWAQGFSWRAGAARMLAVLREVVEARDGAPPE